MRAYDFALFSICMSLSVSIISAFGLFGGTSAGPPPLTEASMAGFNTTAGNEDFAFSGLINGTNVVPGTAEAYYQEQSFSLPSIMGMIGGIMYDTVTGLYRPMQSYGFPPQIYLPMAIVIGFLNVAAGIQFLRGVSFGGGYA